MNNRVRSTLAASLVPMIAVWGVPVTAQGTAPAATEDAGFSTEQLEQMVAPVALYPDSLLMQVLMAATYPLEIVEAERWLGKNATLKDTALDEALKEQDWDASVKSICSFPDVLAKMSDNLEWTQDLGDAFLGQQDQLLDTVQRMRGKAHDAGNLKTTEQQVITVEKEKIIVIQSPAPEIVYVPVYSPTVVYGSSWGYPSYYYPPMYMPPPPGYGLISFGVGLAVGAAIWGGCNWGWGHHSVHVNVNHYNNFNRNTNINVNRNINANINRSGNSSWQHNPSHRGGVNYKNQNVAGKYGAKAGTSRVSSQAARGWSESSTANRAGGGATTRPASAGAGDRAGNRAAGGGVSDKVSNRAAGSGAGDRVGNRAAASGAGDRSVTRPSGSGAGSRPSSTGANRGSGSGSNRSAYSGSRSPGTDRAASSRGSRSRGTSSYGGGGARGGGARGGGRR